MKIDKKYYSFDHDFNIKDNMKMFLENGLRLTKDGTIASFISPIQIKANGETLSFESALNICYIIPDSTKSETVMFSMLYNNELMKMLRDKFHVEKITDSSMILLINDRFAGGSYIKYSDGFCLGWHFIFLSDSSAKLSGIETEKVVIDPPLDEESTKNLHGELDTRFRLLTNHIFINSVSISNFSEQ